MTMKSEQRLNIDVNFPSEYAARLNIGGGEGGAFPPPPHPPWS